MTPHKNYVRASYGNLVRIDSGRLVTGALDAVTFKLRTFMKTHANSQLSCPPYGITTFEIG